ncbi:MAG TPA: type II toxin-antitoxin system PemK/MazF family toxin [Tepidisphaeraceae bacterium]|nr:type II toxin-antitoxin system PemK/MazF family toxin [Tepidisphaeraceae bacterium]
MASFPRRGEIWLVVFPDDPKSRPAVIVSLDARNEFSNSVLAVPVTTNPRPSPTHVALPAKQGGLTHDSMARCENVSYLHKSRLSRGPLGGAISPALMREIERCLLRSLGITT